MSAPLTPEEINKITDYLLIDRTELKNADLLLVFGNKNSCDDLAREAAKLYKQGFAPLIMVTGGVKTDNGQMEADRLATRLMALGVPSKAIISETKSTNTQENIEQARTTLGATGHLPHIKSIIGVGHISAGRRFLMTLSKRWPHALHMFVGVNPYEVAREDWHMHPVFRHQVIGEWAKIPDYLARGFLNEIDISAINDTVRTARNNAPRPRGPAP